MNWNTVHWRRNITTLNSVQTVWQRSHIPQREVTPLQSRDHSTWIPLSRRHSSEYLVHRTLIYTPVQNVLPTNSDTILVKISRKSRRCRWRHIGLSSGITASSKRNVNFFVNPATTSNSLLYRCCCIKNIPVSLRTTRAGHQAYRIVSSQVSAAVIKFCQFTWNVWHFQADNTWWQKWFSGNSTYTHFAWLDLDQWT